MNPESGRISIWFFIGALVLVYGVLVLGAGIYELFSPSPTTVVLSELHAGIWWGALMIVLGAIPFFKSFPRAKE
jgi:uncharacterized membrane protein HdeD (DUF308 family)